MSSTDLDISEQAVRMLGIQNSEVNTYYIKELQSVPAELLQKKVSAMKCIWELLSNDQHTRLRRLFIEIAYWHMRNSQVNTQIEPGLYFSAVTCIPMIDCPYLKSISAYAVYND